MEAELIEPEYDELKEACEAFGIDKIEDVDALVDAFEAGILKEYDQVECPLDHIFTPGLYTRTILMKAPAIITSKIHKTEHPFVILSGMVSVWTKEAGVITIKAPFIGVTKPGTRRVLFIHKDTIWATFHPTELKTVEEIEEKIIEKRTNPLLQQPCLNLS